jgi:alanyl-tRNA synthetase
MSFTCIGVIDTFGESYPELVKEKDNIMEIIEEEEKAFSVMLDRGISYFSDLTEEMKKEGSTEVAGNKAFFLYDTLGFPIDLTEQMAEEAGLTVNSEGFQTEMETQKQRSRDARNAAKLGGAVRLELIAEQTAWLADNGVATTDDDFKYEWDLDLSSSVTAIFTEDGFLKEGEEAGVDTNVGIITDKSSFYAEAGGQESDIGEIKILSDSGDAVATFIVNDVQSYGGYLLHSGSVQEGAIKVGDTVSCKVDYERRRDIAPNHSMTHVLNGALTKVLGDGVEQRGSLCNEEKMRFDFSHKKALKAKELRKVEELCQQSILDAEAVEAKVMPLDEAKQIDGVRAVFGEVYPDPVRVVSVGTDTSVEFCGGTHLTNTAEAENIVLVEETAVAKGIRRITAVTKGLATTAIETGKTFDAKVTEIESLPNDTASLDKTAGALRKELDESYISAVLKGDLRVRIDGIQKKAVEAKKRALAGRVDKCLNLVKEQVATAVEEGAKSLVLDVDIGADSKASQKVMNAVKSIAPDMAFMGISEEEVGSGGKVLAFAVVPDALVDTGFKADDWVRAALAVAGGRGGGRPGNAQGQAPACEDVSEIISASGDFAAEKTAAAV